MRPYRREPDPLTRVAYEEYLNESGIPEGNKLSNGGTVPPTTRLYGTWLRSNDYPAFSAGYQDWLNNKGGNHESNT